jgi:ATP phosphoribosyltransferase
MLPTEVRLLTPFPSVKMGMADAIVDLVSSGTTLRENNLKEIEGGVVLQSQVSLLFLMHEQARTCLHRHTHTHTHSQIGNFYSI